MLRFILNLHGNYIHSRLIWHHELNENFMQVMCQVLSQTRASLSSNLEHFYRLINDLFLILSSFVNFNKRILHTFEQESNKGITVNVIHITLNVLSWNSFHQQCLLNTNIDYKQAIVVNNSLSSLTTFVWSLSQHCWHWYPKASMLVVDGSGRRRL